MKPRFSLVERPDFQLVRERSEVTSCEKIFEFRYRRRYAAGDFVTADAGEHDANSLRPHARREQAVRLVGTTGVGTRNRSKSVPIELELERLLLADVDVSAGAAALFFYFGEIGAFVPVGF